MHAMVLYRCDCLLEMNGFEETLGRCEDYGIYLRITQATRRSLRSTGGIARTCPTILEKCIWADASFVTAMRRIASDPTTLDVLEEGQANRRDEYARWFYAAGADWRRRREIGKAMWSLAQAARLSPLLILRLMLISLRRRLTTST
jgi:hypothetical protein